MKKLIITVLMMCSLGQGAFGAEDESGAGARDVAAATVELSARERAYVSSLLQKKDISILCLDGTNLSVSIRGNATVGTLKDKISTSQKRPAISFELFVAGNEDKLANSRKISDLGIGDGAVVFMLPANDRPALMALYKNTKGANWTNGNNRPSGPWKIDEPISTWYDVKVNDDGRVTELNLQNRQLTGTIPAELGQLGALTGLNLSYNELSGPIPKELGNLSALIFLTLNNNNLTGEIPAELGQLGDLRFLSLNNNRLSGSIPAELGQLGALTHLNLNNNQLTGSIPAAVNRLDAYKYFSGNNLDHGLCSIQ